MRYPASLPVSLRAFVLGTVAGALFGSAAVAAAAFGYAGWQKFTNDFKNGYVTGFLDMANVARNLDAGGWVDEKYPWTPKVKPPEWRGVVDKLYKDPANQVYNVMSILQLAAKTIADRHGGALDPDERMRQRTESVLNELRKKAIAEGQDPSKVPNIPGHIVVPASPGDAAEEPPHQRKWCRCDGKDPNQLKAEREKAEAEDKAKQNGAAAPPIAPPGTEATKTPPNAAPAAHAGGGAAGSAPAKTPPVDTKAPANGSK
ncbi:MAG TPA: hypothetical protein VGK20_05440 [Candidatus Binatia bacterium]